MDTRDAQRASRTKDDKDKHRDVVEPSPPIEASDIESEGVDLLLALSASQKEKSATSDEMNQLYVQQASTSETAKKDEIAEIPFPQPPGHQSPSLPVSKWSWVIRFTNRSDFFSDCLKLHRGIKTIPSWFNYLPPKFLLPFLEHEGMSNEINSARLRNMLHSSGYIQTYKANMSYEQFSLFDSDFELVRALRNSESQPEGMSDLVGLRKFFKRLEPGENSVYVTHQFVSAFQALDLTLTFADGFCLERCAMIHPEFSLDSQLIIGMLQSRVEEFQGTAEQYLGFWPQITNPNDDFLQLSRRVDIARDELKYLKSIQGNATVTLDRGQRLHRMMLFVAAYVRRNRVSSLRTSSHAMPSSSHVTPSSIT